MISIQYYMGHSYFTHFLMLFYSPKVCFCLLVYLMFELLFIFIYLKEFTVCVNQREKKRERQSVLLTGWFLQYLQQVVLTHIQMKIPELYQALPYWCQGSRTWAVVSCLPRCIRRTFDWKQRSRDTNWHFNVSCRCSKE